MVKLTDTDKQDLERAVAGAEAKTSAEIVLVIADACDEYRLHTVPFALGAGFVVFGVLAVLMPDLSLRYAFSAAGGATLLTALALQWRPLRLLATPRAIQEDAAERLAHAAFVERVAGRTSASNGLLIFLALAEHHVELVPEPGLAARVPQAVWQKIMDVLIAEMKAGRVMTGLRAAIASCGDAAGAAFPPGSNDRDELANAPQVLER